MKYLKIYFLISVLTLTYLFGFFSNHYGIFPYKIVLSAKNYINQNIISEDLRRDIKIMLFNLSQDGNKVNFNELTQKKISYAVNSEKNILLTNSNKYGLSKEKYKLLIKDFNLKPKFLNSKLNFENIFDNFDNSSNIIFHYIIENETKVLLQNNSRLHLFHINGEELWKKEISSLHHWGHYNSKEVVFPFREYLKYPTDAKKYNISFFEKCDFSINNWNEGIEIIDINNGKTLDKIYILQIISNNQNLVERISQCHDPLHINDVRILNDIEANKLGVDEGDYLISLLSAKSILIISKKNKKIVKSFKVNSHVHSPRIWNDYIVFLNNKSRIISDITLEESSSIDFMNIKTGKVEYQYTGSKDIFFKTDGAGRISIKNNDFFISSYHQGEVYKLNCSPNKINCEFREIVYKSLPLENYLYDVEEDGDFIRPNFIADVY